MGIIVVIVIGLAMTRRVMSIVAFNHLEEVQKSFTTYSQGKSYITEKDLSLITKINQYIQRKNIKEETKLDYWMRKFLNADKVGYLSYGGIKIIGSLVQLVIWAIAIGTSVYWQGIYDLQNNLIEGIGYGFILIVAVASSTQHRLKKHAKKEKELATNITSLICVSEEGKLMVRELERQRKQTSLGEINGLNEVFSVNHINEDGENLEKEAVVDLGEKGKDKKKVKDPLKAQDIEMIISQIEE